MMLVARHYGFQPNPLDLLRVCFKDLCIVRFNDLLRVFVEGLGGSMS